MGRQSIQVLLKLISGILLLTTLLGIAYFTITGQFVWVLPFLTVPMVVIMILPLMYQKEKFDIFHPLIFVLGSLMIGTVLRSFFIISPLQSTAKPLMLMGKDPYFLLKGILYIYLGIICFIFGYMMKIRVSPLMRKKIYRTDIKFSRFKILALFIMPLSVAAAYLFLKRMGLSVQQILAFSDISAKRGLKLEQGGVSALGYYRVVMNLVKPVYFILLIYMIKNKVKVMSIPGMLILALGFLNVFYPFINSSRSEALEVFIFSGIIYVYIKGKVEVRKLAWVFAAAAIVLIVMTALRNKVSSASEANTNLFTIVVGSLNFLGVDKMSHIVDDVPGKMQYQLGETLFLWVVAPVPRTLWPGKPETSIGRTIGDVIYEKRDDDTTGGGVPPGFIAELYLNFGAVGIIIGMFLLGWFMKYFYLKFREVRQDSTFGLLIYTLVIVPVSFFMIGEDISRHVINSLITIIPIYVIFKLTGYEKFKYAT